jgi:ribulose-5-phosphate 4-epimerase/fuculose-1-phosphate aldolase
MIVSGKISFVVFFLWVTFSCSASSVTNVIEPRDIAAVPSNGIHVEDAAAPSLNEDESCDSFSNVSDTMQRQNTVADDVSKIDRQSSPTIIPQPDPSIIGYPVSRYSPDRRQVDQVTTVRPEHATENPSGVCDYEWTARTELAAAYRSLYLAGLGSDQAAQCLMLRVSHPPGGVNGVDSITFLMADWGVWFEEVTASNLLHFTVDGQQVDYDTNSGYTTTPADPIRANSGCIPVAKAIFEARPDVSMIVHIHPQAVMAVGGMEYGLLPLSQAAFFLWGQVSREDYDFTYENSFEENLASGFSKGQRAMLLNHHGMYAVGRDVAEGLFVATHLTQACQVQVQTLSMAGGDLDRVILPSGEDLSHQYKDMMDSTDYSYDGSREWPGIVRKVQREAPDYNL